MTKESGISGFDLRVCWLQVDCTHFTTDLRVVQVMRHVTLHQVIWLAEGRNGESDKR